MGLWIGVGNTLLGTRCALRGTRSRERAVLKHAVGTWLLRLNLVKGPRAGGVELNEAKNSAASPFAETFVPSLVKIHVQSAALAPRHWVISLRAGE